MRNQISSVLHPPLREVPSEAGRRVLSATSEKADRSTGKEDDRTITGHPHAECYDGEKYYMNTHYSRDNRQRITDNRQP
jgi:hypothetical protein